MASVSATGEVLALKDGQTTITITRGDDKREVPVTVSGVVEHPVVRFSEQIRPILNKAGCAMAACHAAQHGKGGFKLSVFGFEPDKDREAMVRDSLARRVDFVDPERSLLLLKPTMQTPHGGGKRLEKGSVDYQILLAWIAGGAPRPAEGRCRSRQAARSRRRSASGQVGHDAAIARRSGVLPTASAAMSPPGPGSIRSTTAW